MHDLRAIGLIKLKAILFVCAGSLACALLLLDHRSLRFVFLLATAIWCFCRAYYFVFYVIEHYIDPSYKFSGLLSFARHWLLPQANNRRTR